MGSNGQKCEVIYIVWYKEKRNSEVVNAFEIIIAAVPTRMLEKVHRGIQKMYADALGNPVRAKEILHNAVDDLVKLTTPSKNTQEVENAQRLLHEQIEKSTSVSASQDLIEKGSLTRTLIETANSHLSKREKKHNYWQTIHSNLANIASLASKGREVGLTDGYHREALSTNHVPLPRGLKDIFIEMLDKAFDSQDTSWFQNFGLEEKIQKNLHSTKGNRNEFFAKCTSDLKDYYLKQKEFTGEAPFPEECLRKLEGVKYLEVQEREQYKITFGEDGKIYQNGEVFDTSQMRGKNAKGLAAFVIKDGQLYCAQHVGGEFHHSSFMAGKSVSCAGMIRVENGKITMMSNTSGHYAPQEHHMVEALKLIPEEVFSADAKIEISGADGRRVSSESREDFLRRAAPLAKKKWDEVYKLRQEYAEYTGFELHSADAQMREELLLEKVRIMNESVGNTLLPSHHQRSNNIPVAFSKADLAELKELCALLERQSNSQMPYKDKAELVSPLAKIGAEHGR